MPTLTIVIPTIGRPTLKRTLDSIRGQELLAGDQVVVALDTLDEPPRPDVEALVASYGPPFTLLRHAGYDHWRGMHQLNEAIRTATTHYLCGLGDDDSYTVDAIKRLRSHLAPDRVCLFQFVHPRPVRAVIWASAVLCPYNISGCCMAAPVAGLHPAPLDHEDLSDYWWIEDNVADRAIAWIDEVYVVARPDAETERQWPTVGWRPC